MLAITHGGQRKLLPEGWSDAGPLAWPMLRALARLPPPAGKLEAMRLLTGLSRRQFARLSAEEITTLSVALPWLVPGPLTAPLQPRFRLGWRSYYLPEAKFSNGQCLAFALADEFFTAALKPGADVATSATRLLGTIARPMKRGKRATLSGRGEVMARAKLFTKLPPEHAMHALMYWAGVKMAVDDLYGEYLFKGSPLDKAPAGKIPDFGWWARFQDVAESGIFGTLADVNTHSFHEVCTWMLRKEAQRRSQQLEMETQRNK